MRRTVWTLLFALLLQLVAGSAWAAWASQADSPQMPCHELLVHDAADSDTHHPQQPQNSAHHAKVQADGHHCCAVGLGTGAQMLLAPLSQAAPISRHGRWISLSLRPDLRPPI